MNVTKTNRNILILLTAGAVTGLLGGFLGISAGFLVLFVLMLFFKFDEDMAGAESAIVTACVSSVGAYLYWSKGLVNTSLVLPAMLGTLFGTIIALLTGKRGDARSRQSGSAVVFGVLGIIILAVSFGLLNVGFFSSLISPIIMAALAGLLAGFIGSRIRLSGGFAVVPLLVILAGVGQHVAQGLSLAIIVPMSIFMSVYQLAKHRLDMRVGFWTCSGAIFGTVAGFMSAQRLEGRTLQMIFGLVLVLVSAVNIYYIARKQKKTLE